MADHAAPSLRQRAEAAQAAGVFLGGPIRKFEAVGRHQLAILLRHGLNFDSRVLDVGCGALRAGYWIMRFLDPGGYFGIEPNRQMLEGGQRMIVTPAVIEAKRPRFDHNADFDFSVFGTTFDFVIARSVWTHTGVDQLRTMLDQFTATAPQGVMLASIKECPWYRRQHRGNGWVGRSHESDEGGTVAYRFSWIAAECRRRGLTARRLEKEYGQTWIRVSAPDRDDHL